MHTKQGLLFFSDGLIAMTQKISQKRFKALVAEQNAEGVFVRRIKEKSVEELPAGEVLVRVLYSSLNYKDALSASGNRGVTRHFPHTPGIDAAGIVEESSVKAFEPGEEVVVSCYDLGMNTPGGFGQYIRVPAGWVMKLPGDLGLKESMIYGTAGFTAANSVYRLVEYGIKPTDGKILVTGATGGVGSISIAILSKIGYQVTAVTGKKDQQQFLFDLGAAEILPRENVMDTSDRMLLKAKWAGVVDTVGGDILATAIKSTKYRGAVTCCGNVASPNLSLNVYPFIIRGVSLIGIDSASCPMEFRLHIWKKMAGDWKPALLESLAAEISLEELDNHIELILHGGQHGRVVVNLQ